MLSAWSHKWPNASASPPIETLVVGIATAVMAMQPSAWLMCQARRVRKARRSTWTALAPGASSARVEADTQPMGANRPPQVICGHSFSRRDLDVEGAYGDEPVARRGGGSAPFRGGPLQAGGPRPEHPVHGRLTGRSASGYRRPTPAQIRHRR